MRIFEKIVAIAVFMALPASVAFSATMEQKVRRVPSDIQEAVFLAPEENLPALVQNLTNGVSAPASKVKVLHDWICDNIAYDTDVFTPAGAGRQDYATVLTKKKGVCAGYTNLFTKMASLAGLEAIGIEGWSKGFAYPGYIDEDDTNHTWNAVKIGNKWQLIDVTWDAGYVDGKFFIKSYSTEWLSRTPEQFIYSHLPEEDEYQYLAKPRTHEQFAAEPYIPGVFFDSGLSFASAMPGYTNEIEGTASWDIRISKSNLVLRPDMYDRTGGRGIVDGSAWFEKSGAKNIVYFDVPDTNVYRARLYVYNSSETKNPDYFSIGEFEGSILPRAANLLSAKKITQKEYDYLVASYWKCNENNNYYKNEDLFDTARNTAVTKVLRLLEENKGSYTRVLYFDVKAKNGYNGYGKSEQRFPLPYQYYMLTKNTQTIAPASGTVKKGSSVHFELSSRDYTTFAFVVNDEFTFFNRDTKTNTFSLDYTVPKNVQMLDLYASKDGKNYVSLWGYQVK